MWSPSRSSNYPSQSPAEPQGNAPAPRSAAPITSRQYEGGSYIGKSLVIRGEVSGSEPVHIEGRVEGPISFGDCHVNVGREGVVMSNVEAGEVIVRGTLQGNLTVIDRVEVHGGGSVKGDVAAGRVSIECGAYFKGSIDMRRPDPKAHLETSTKTEQKKNSVDESQHAPALTY